MVGIIRELSDMNIITCADYLNIYIIVLEYDLQGATYCSSVYISAV